MRDVRSVIVTEVQKTFQNGVHIQTTDFTRNDVRTQRSDAVSTAPLPGGGYGHPTNYTAFFGDTWSEAGRASWKRGDWGYLNPSFFEVRWDGGSDRNLIDYGCANLLPVASAATRNRAASLITEKIKANDLDIGVTLGEARDALSTINVVIKQVVRLVKDYVDLINPSIPRSSRFYAQEWLRFQFGIKPLMSDAYAACILIQNGMQAPVAAKVKVVVDDTSFQLPPDLSYRFHSGKVRRGVEIQYYYTVSNKAGFDAWRYGLTSPLSIAWELMSYSFVVDWFLHLGNFIRGLEGPIGLSLADGYRTTFLNNNILIEENPLPNEYGKQIPGTDWLRHVEINNRRTWVRTKAMNREVFNHLAIPMPYLSLGLNLNQAISGIALIASRLKV